VLVVVREAEEGSRADGDDGDGDGEKKVSVVKSAEACGGWQFARARGLLWLDRWRLNLGFQQTIDGKGLARAI
jgi:hypothetical protein